MKYSLLDFVRGGLQLNLMIAVDFTVIHNNEHYMYISLFFSLLTMFFIYHTTYNFISNT